MNEFDGLILIDKDQGITSHDVVDDLRKIFAMKNIGHGGTLDPLATGMLVGLLGEATKLSQYVMAEEKSYRAGIRLGVKTDTGDITGKIIEEKDSTTLTEGRIQDEVAKLTGALELEVPKYSAIKVNGKKLYEYARAEAEVELPKKTMTVTKASVVEFQRGHVLVDLDCEKGTYVRSWAEELGRVLGCGATVDSLRRTKSGAYGIEQAFKTADLQKLSLEELRAKVIPLADVLKAWPALKVVGREEALVRNGQLPKAVFSQLIHFKFDAGVRLLSPEGKLLALAVKEPGIGLKLGRVFGVKS
jgi:tRNA pseudouridine55 synthase